ncbi:MAG: phosphate sensor histidine kinase, HAMP and PAS domain-containing [Promethearchaeota archaeon CR_4]|nr:MAG: phosphate sensor histidine kinase, HAMP and PAS domain-containing [Candidatus Lokiarchaeota archaeon CR_4]
MGLKTQPLEENLYQSTLDAMKDSIHVIDRDFRVLVVNKAYLELTKRAGYALNPRGQDLFEMYPFLPQTVRLEYQQVFEAGQPLKTQEKTPIKGAVFYTETQKIPIFKEGMVQHVLTIIRDISEWKHADIFKANLIAFAAHELKTPLIPILGWADYIKEEMEKGENLNVPDGQEAITSVIRNAERMKNIIERYLDVGRIEVGRLVLSIEQIELSKLISDAIAAVYHLKKEKHIRFYLDIPSILFRADTFYLGQVLINLLSNAITYSPPNTSVRIRAEDLDDCLKIKIQDNGYGFTAMELENISQIFSRSFSTPNNDKIFTGSGVGLYICQRILEAHGGSLEIQSLGKNKGTTASVTLLKDPESAYVLK